MQHHFSHLTYTHSLVAHTHTQTEAVSLTDSFLWFPLRQCVIWDWGPRLNMGYRTLFYGPSGPCITKVRAASVFSTQSQIRFAVGVEIRRGRPLSPSIIVSCNIRDSANDWEPKAHSLQNVKNNHDNRWFTVKVRLLYLSEFTHIWFPVWIPHLFRIHYWWVLIAIKHLYVPVNPSNTNPYIYFAWILIYSLSSKAYQVLFHL